jgi:hypothetical protein
LPGDIEAGQQQLLAQLRGGWFVRAAPRITRCSALHPSMRHMVLVRVAKCRCLQLLNTKHQLLLKSKHKSVSSSVLVTG